MKYSARARLPRTSCTKGGCHRQGRLRVRVRVGLRLWGEPPPEPVRVNALARRFFQPRAPGLGKQDPSKGLQVTGG